jgi:hypothetical protein
MGSTATTASDPRRWAPRARLLEADPPPAGSRAPAPADQRRAAPESAILCATCGQTITRERERIRILEAHEHRFMNPVGSLFHIGCFAHAEGCLPIGAASADYPWFPGFAWRIALCARCGEHLGWLFEAGDRSFFGLRLDRLRAGGAT